MLLNLTIFWAISNKYYSCGFKYYNFVVQQKKWQLCTALKVMSYYRKRREKGKKKWEKEIKKKVNTSWIVKNGMGCCAITKCIASSVMFSQFNYILSNFK